MIITPGIRCLRTLLIKVYPNHPQKYVGWDWRDMLIMQLFAGVDRSILPYLNLEKTRLYYVYDWDICSYELNTGDKEQMLSDTNYQSMTFKSCG